MARSPIRVTSSVALKTRAGTLAGERWITLLEKIAETRSISAAARAVPLSYKAAWDAVEAMNNIAGATLVERAVGGKNGGGATLTARGRQLVATYRAAEAENARFLDALNARIGDAEPDLRLLGRFKMLTSARNHLAGRVVAITRGAVNDEIDLELPGGARIAAVITHASTEALNLRVGSEAIALIKASWVLVATDAGIAKTLSARNQLAGTVSTLTPGAVNSEVVITLPGGQTIAAIITQPAVKALKLKVGTPAIAVFKASSVILSVDA